MEKRFGKIINEAFGPVEIKDESEKYVGCRIKRLSAVQDGVEAYYLIAITVDDEALDMLLHILDSYSEDEYKAL